MGVESYASRFNDPVFRCTQIELIFTERIKDQVLTGTQFHGNPPRLTTAAYDVESITFWEKS